MSLITSNIKKIIDEKGLKQKYIAERAGITERKMSDILCGRKIIDEDVIILLCKALEVVPNDLFGYDRSA